MRFLPSIHSLCIGKLIRRLQMFGDLARFQSLVAVVAAQAYQVYTPNETGSKIAIGGATYDGDGSGSDFGGVRPRDTRSRSSIPVGFVSFSSLHVGKRGGYEACALLLVGGVLIVEPQVMRVFVFRALG